LALAIELSSILFAVEELARALEKRGNELGKAASQLE
jgi:hypothetical protein